jgi:hypothetical protein
VRTAVVIREFHSIYRQLFPIDGHDAGQAGTVPGKEAVYQCMCTEGRPVLRKQSRCPKSRHDAWNGGSVCARKTVPSFAGSLRAQRVDTVPGIKASYPALYCPGQNIFREDAV